MLVQIILVSSVPVLGIPKQDILVLNIPMIKTNMPALGVPILDILTIDVQVLGKLLSNTSLAVFAFSIAKNCNAEIVAMLYISYFFFTYKNCNIEEVAVDMPTARTWFSFFLLRKLQYNGNSYITYFFLLFYFKNNHVGDNVAGVPATNVIVVKVLFSVFQLSKL